MKYWLLKSEPEVYSIDHLKKDHQTDWEGVRNYLARNYMMKEMSLGDLCFFYHSNSDPAGITGVAKVSRQAEPDLLQFNKKSEFYDQKSTRQNPRWFCVQIQFVKKFKNLISLARLKQEYALQKMALVQKGQRLSVQPVSQTEFDFILSIAEAGSRPRLDQSVSEN